MTGRLTLQISRRIISQVQVSPDIFTIMLRSVVCKYPPFRLPTISEEPITLADCTTPTYGSTAATSQRRSAGTHSARARALQRTDGDNLSTAQRMISLNLKLKMGS